MNKSQANPYKCNHASLSLAIKKKSSTNHTPYIHMWHKVDHWIKH